MSKRLRSLPAWFRHLMLAAFALAATSAGAADADGPPKEIAGPVEARVVKVRDGDTVEVDAFVWPMQSVRVAVRLRGIDAPEIRGECEAEKAAARSARDRLVELLAEGPVTLGRIEGDKYFGRVLADLSSPAEADIAKRLLREGLVDAYDGGKRRDWCTAVGANRWTDWLTGRG